MAGLYIGSLFQPGRTNIEQTSETVAEAGYHRVQLFSEGRLAHVQGTGQLNTAVLKILNLVKHH